MLRLLPLLVLLVLRTAFGDACLTLLDPPAPLGVTLNDGNASLALTLSTCVSSDLFVTSDPPYLEPVLVSPPSHALSSDCRDVRVALAFFRTIGKGVLSFSASNCSLTVPIVAAGVSAVHLPSRNRVTATDTAPIPVSAPLGAPVVQEFSVKAVIPTGETLRGEAVAAGVTVSLAPPDASVDAILENRDGANLRIVSKDDGGDEPRPEFVQEAMLRVVRTGASANFRLLHAALAPAVLEVRAPKVLSLTGGDLVTLVVNRAAADQRGLRIGDVLIPELEYRRNGSEYQSVFKTPPLSPGEHKWELELVTDENIAVAADESGFSFVTGVVPFLSSLIPSVSAPGADGFVIVSGSFDESAVLLIDGEPPPARDVLSVESGEIVMRIPEVDAAFTGTVEVVLVTNNGTRSNALSLAFDPEAISINAVVLHAAYDGKDGRYNIPSLCNYSQPPTILAQANNLRDELERPKFTFSFRASNASGFSTFASGTSTLATLGEDGLFGTETELDDDVFPVLVAVSQGERTGETLLFIAKRLQPKTIGVTVLSRAGSLAGKGSPAVLDAHVAPVTHCADAQHFELRAVWSLNKTKVGPYDVDTPLSPGNLDSPGTVGFGRTLVNPVYGRFLYQVMFKVKDKRSGNVIAEGSASGRGMVDRRADSLRLSLNGGLRSITVPRGIRSYTIQASSPTNDAKSTTTSSLRYSWTCKTEPGGGVCPPSLFPSDLAEGSSKVDAFNISTESVTEGTRLRYALTVTAGNRSSETVPLDLTVGSERDSVFPASEMTAAATLPDVLPDGLLQFQCYDAIVLSVLETNPVEGLSFALFKEGSGDKLVDLQKNGILIEHNGYWSPRHPVGRFFGIKRNKLEEGNYVLFGALNANAEPGMGASWSFRVEACPSLALSLSGTNGEASQTVFFASATSIPSSQNRFFFALKRDNTNDTLSMTNFDRINSTNCLQGCPGGQVASFQVAAEGRYRVQVDMYDSSGTHLLASTKSASPILVGPGTSGNVSEMLEPEESATRARTALQLNDEGTFLDAVIQVSARTDLKASFLNETIQGLLALVFDPVQGPLRRARIVEASTSLLSLEKLQEIHDIEAVQRIVDLAVVGGLTNTGPGSVLIESVTNYYATVSNKLSRISNSSLGREEANVLNKLAAGARESAAMHIPLLLSSGRECGFVDRAIVPFSARTRFNISAGAPEVMSVDDYRIGVCCYPGQIRILSPEPALLRKCSERDVSSEARPGEAEILISAEQHDVLEKELQGSNLSGPLVQASLMRRVASGDGSFLVPQSERLFPCYQTRISAYVSKDLAEQLFSSVRSGGELTCREAGDVFHGNSAERLLNGTGSNSRSKVSRFELGSDGRISTFVESMPPVAARVSLNASELRRCVTGLGVEGRQDSATTAVLLSVSAGVALLLALIAIVMCYARDRRRDEKYSVPASVAPWDSFEASGSMTRSTLGSYNFNSDDQNQVRNEWEAEYTALHAPGQTHRRQPPPPNDKELRESNANHSGVEFDDATRGEPSPESSSHGSSILTVSESLTMSSGDLNPYMRGQLVRIAGHNPGMNAVPNCNVPGAYSRSQNDT